jgi:flagellar hook-associated protein 3 FlgL
MSFGRIPTNYAFIRSMQSIRNTYKNMDELREKMNTGKEINRPSDDPTGFQKALSLGGSIRENERYLENIELGVGRLNAASSKLQQVEDILLELTNIVSVAASDAATSAERTGYVQQVDMFLEQIVTLANSQYQGKFLFGGVNTTSGTCPLSLPFNARYGADGFISGVAQNPRGINALVNTTILPGVDGAVNISGAAPFQPNGSGGIGDVFNVLITIRDQLRTSDVTGLNASQQDLQEAISQVTQQDVIIGAKTNILEISKNTLETTIVNETEARSRVEDADYAKLLIEYSTAEMLFNSTLSATATLLQNSLINFI